VLSLFRSPSTRWRAAGGLLCFPTALGYWVTTVATVRYGINASGDWREPRHHAAEVFILAALYISSFTLVWLRRHRRTVGKSAPN
jgi:hypothetical protein